MTPSSPRSPESRRSVPRGADEDHPVPRLYERGIEACAARSDREVGEVVTRLVATLDFEHEAAATVLFRLYDFCQRRARAGEFDTAARIFREFRAAWAQVAAAAPGARQGLPRRSPPRTRPVGAEAPEVPDSVRPGRAAGGGPGLARESRGTTDVDRGRGA